MKVKDFKDIADDFELNTQLLASELDTSLNRMKYISLSDCKSKDDIESFNNLWNKIVDEGANIVSISEECDLCEIEDICIITYSDLNHKMFIFDIQDSLLVEEILATWKK